MLFCYCLDYSFYSMDYCWNLLYSQPSNPSIIIPHLIYNLSSYAIILHYLVTNFSLLFYLRHFTHLQTNISPKSLWIHRRFYFISFIRISYPLLGIQYLPLYTSTFTNPASINTKYKLYLQNFDYNYIYQKF